MTPPPELTADCTRCAALCCVLPPFARSADFPLDKAAGAPCPNLGGDHTCRVHAARQELGFRGCISFACFGAGQRLTQHTFAGRDWRQEPVLLVPMGRAFQTLYALHGLLWHLDAALKLPVSASLKTRLQDLVERTSMLTAASAEALLALDAGPLRAEGHGLLTAASAEVRRPLGRAPRRARWMGARLPGADLRGLDLFGVGLLGADLSGADLRGADLRGADLRGADLSGADLRGALFLTQGQLDSARGDGQTRLDPSLQRPAAWSGASPAASHSATSSPS